MPERPDSDAKMEPWYPKDNIAGIMARNSLLGPFAILTIVLSIKLLLKSFSQHAHLITIPNCFTETTELVDFQLDADN